MDGHGQPFEYASVDPRELPYNAEYFRRNPYYPAHDRGYHTPSQINNVRWPLGIPSHLRSDLEKRGLAYSAPHHRYPMIHEHARNSPLVRRQHSQYRPESMRGGRRHYHSDYSYDEESDESFTSSYDSKSYTSGYSSSYSDTDASSATPTSFSRRREKKRASKDHNEFDISILHLFVYEQI